MAFTIEDGVLIKYDEEEGVTDVIIPASVTSIGEYAFEGCSSLTSVTIPNSVIIIGDNAFEGCSNLVSVKIPESVTSIGSCAFFECSSLTSVTIPNSVTSISGGIFWNCSSLISVKLPDNMTSIYDGTFDGCESLTSVTIPNSVTSIGDEAFKDCENLTIDKLPDNLMSIGDRAFSGCSFLPSVKIPDSVKSITGIADFDLSWIENQPGDFVIVGENILIAYKGTETSVKIPNGVKCIAGSAFEGCSNLTSVTIPDSVIDIGNLAFADCSNLTSITLPDSVTFPDAEMLMTGEYDALNDCKSLKHICVTGKYGTTGKYDVHGNFEGVYALANKIELALSMINEKDFSFKYRDEKNDSKIKYPFILGYYKSTKDPAVVAYIKNQCLEIINYAITQGDVSAIKAFTETTLFTKENIDLFIEEAIEEKQYEIQVILVNYKKEQFGFEESDKKWKL